jgi:membrane protein involved in colicin uptake
MTDAIESQDGENPEAVIETPTDTSELKLDKTLEELLAKKVEENLKPIKEKLDSAFKARDEALRKAAELEQEKKDAEKARLREQGKLQELAERELAEERAKRETLEKRNVELTRDINVRNALAALPFRNDRASDIAYRDIVSELVQNDNGDWVHKSGVSIRDYAMAYADQSDNSFLFKQKVSSGSGGTGPAKNADSSSGKKSLFNMSQDEVIKLAMENKLPSQT